jgi:hypothetical protein
MNAKTDDRQEDARRSSNKENRDGSSSTTATRSGKKEESMRIWMDVEKKEKEETKLVRKLVTRGLFVFSFRRNRREKLSM